MRMSVYPEDGDGDQRRALSVNMGFIKSIRNCRGYVRICKEKKRFMYFIFLFADYFTTLELTHICIMNCETK